MSDSTQGQHAGQDAASEIASADAEAREATTVAAMHQPMSQPSPADTALVNALRRGDEAAFERLVDEYYAPLLRLALLYVRSRAVAEDVVQETWIGVLRGLDRFEGRSSLKTWIFRILTNTAKTRAQREGRSIPFSALSEEEAEGGEPAVDPAYFLPADDPQWPGHWASVPRNWDEVPEERLLSLEARELIRAAIEALPPTQREVITLRDVEGWTSQEVCNLLNISESNQRVLLHRARSRVRRALDAYIRDE
jgi:RNA polymerase sigma-70 factor (ECF subfamily)